MADIVNLRRFRKQKARAAAEEDAETNRVRFGRTLAERQETKAQQDLAQRRLDGHKLSE